MEYEAIDANSLVVSHTELLDQPWLIAKCAQCRHKPAIAVSTLPNIVCGRAVDVELWLIEDIDNSLDASGSELGAGRIALGGVCERLQTVVDIELQVSFDIEVRISIFLVDPSTFLDDLFNLGAAHSCGIVVGSLGGCSRDLDVFLGNDRVVKVVMGDNRRGLKWLS